MNTLHHGTKNGTLFSLGVRELVSNRGVMLTPPVSPSQDQLPPYVLIILQHTRLSVLTSLLGGTDNLQGSSTVLWSAGINAACEVMRTAIDSAHSLRAIVCFSGVIFASALRWSGSCTLTRLLRW
jgi:hypothetical protein